jgi:hypothetical protein
MGEGAVQRWVLALVAVTVLMAAAFVAGSAWRGRRQVQVEEERGRFFEAAQGQFHWPDGAKEWTEMLVPLGGVDFSGFGDRWLFGAMYEGTQRKCEVEVVLRDNKGGEQLAGAHTLERGVPDKVALDLGGLRKKLDLKSVREMVLRMHGEGKAGRMLVAGLVNPRPALIRRLDEK